MYDIIIIGAGVSGCSCARELSRLNADICVVEKAEDVCCGTSKANSAIVHAGYDAAAGTLMARLNVEGNSLMEELSRDLDFLFRRNGSLVLCMHQEELSNLHELYERGIKNGVKGLHILGREELDQMEPNVTKQAVAALYAPTGGIVCPFGLTIALAENAAANGVEFRFDTKVRSVKRAEEGFELATDKGKLTARLVVNAAGVYADQFHNMVSGEKIHITPRRGDYCLLDKAAGNLVSKTVFTLPGRLGKGILVTPTIHGNLMMGPTAIDVDSREGTNTTREGLDQVLTKAALSVDHLPLRQVITSFAGLRAHEDHHEFIIKELEDCPGFIDCAGIESPGLSSSPAIGRMVAQIVREKEQFSEKEHFIATRKGILDPKALTAKEQSELIREKPEYGNLICRCEMISEGEILDAIRRPLGAKSLDGVKRRTRAGAGRCQSGFCSPRVMDLLSRELNIPMLDVTKSGGSSRIVVGINKDQL